MNILIIISGIAYTLLSLLVGVISIFLTFRFLRFFHKSMINDAVLNNDNIALSLYISASIFSVAWVMKGAIEPAITAFNLVLRDPSSVLIDYLIIFGIILFQLVGSGILSFCFILIGLWIFTKLTKDIQEMEEIKRNNIALGILLSTLIIVLVLFIQPGISMIMDGMIPFPQIGIK